MATLPGLPMFGHGQIEGFTEKYGMEYRGRATTRRPDHWLVERHEREIAPLLKRRWLFAESSNFLLYDFFQAGGSWTKTSLPTPTATAASARWWSTTTATARTHGTIDFSAAYADKGSGQLASSACARASGLSGGLRRHPRLSRLAYRP
jgi:hypothetical protein